MKFLVAGYVLTWGVLAWYVWRLERRARTTSRALEGLGSSHRSSHGSEGGAGA